MAQEHARLDAIERQLGRTISLVPYLLLAVSAALSDLSADRPWDVRLVTLGLAALAGAWMGVMTRLRPPGPVYVCGLVVLIGVLSWRDPWFAAFFGFVGYLHSWRYLTGAWRIVGITATAGVTMFALLRALIAEGPLGVLAYVLVVAAVALLVVLFSLLGDVTGQRSAARMELVARLEETIVENGRLHARLLEQAREAGALDERQRIARDIHDTLAQNFIGIVTQLQAAQAAGTGAGDAAWRRRVDTAVGLAREGLEEARRSVRAIGPRVLEQAQLPEAIASFAADWNRRGEVTAELTTTGRTRPLRPEIETTLLRIVQEALANVAQHAQARRAIITLSYMDDVVSVDVCDDGDGFDIGSASTGTGFGLTSMRERAARIAGTVDIESAPGTGTVVSARVPTLSPEET